MEWPKLDWSERPLHNCILRRTWVKHMVCVSCSLGLWLNLPMHTQQSLIQIANRIFFKTSLYVLYNLKKLQKHASHESMQEDYAIRNNCGKGRHENYMYMPYIHLLCIFCRWGAAFNLLLFLLTDRSLDSLLAYFLFSLVSVLLSGPSLYNQGRQQ